MRKRATTWALGMLAGLGLSGAASADALRCGSKLITRGDHAAEVLHYCGEPAAVHTRVIRRGAIGTRGLILPGFVEEVLVEVWTYNFGPHKLMRQLRIENGILREVEQLGYGYRER